MLQTSPPLRSSFSAATLLAGYGRFGLTASSSIPGCEASSLYSSPVLAMTKRTRGTFAFAAAMRFWAPSRLARQMPSAFCVRRTAARLTIALLTSARVYEVRSSGAKMSSMLKCRSVMPCSK